MAALRKIVDANRQRMKLVQDPASKKPPSEPPPGFPSVPDDIFLTVLLYLVPDASATDPVHREMSILLPTKTLKGTALFDSGALHASYVSKAFVDTQRNVLAPFF